MKLTPRLLVVTSLLCVSMLTQAALLRLKLDVHGVTYVTGGIGAEEMEEINAYKKQFKLYFVFSEGKAGRLVDDVNISIMNNSNEVLFNLKHAAPRLLLNLPTGKYQVQASYLGHQQRLVFEHNEEKPQRIIINWKNSIEEDVPDMLPDEVPDTAEIPETQP